MYSYYKSQDSINHENCGPFIVKHIVLVDCYVYNYIPIIIITLVAMKMGKLSGTHAMVLVNTLVE